MEGNPGKRKKSAQSAGAVPKMAKTGEAVKQEGEMGDKVKVVEVELLPMNGDSPEESIRELWKEEEGEERNSSPRSGSLETLDPFTIFPLEVWEMILDRLNDSKLAWNLLKAFPKLDKEPSLQKKKRVWLFGLVIPHMIYNRLEGSCWIEDKDLRSCRQVCTTWSSAVDTFLAHQPQLKVPDPEIEQAGQFNWNLKAYMDRQMKQPRIHSKGVKLSVEEHTDTQRKLTVSKFLSESEGHPPGRNPFVSRSLSLNIWPPLLSRDDINNEAERNSMLELHQRFGKHVWFYELEFQYHNRFDDSIIIRHLAESIIHLPNLRLLRIIGGSYCSDIPKETVKLLESNLPPLPHLETLLIDFGNFPWEVSGLLFHRFSNQIRRLQMEDAPWLLKNEYFQLFSNLTDLEMSYIGPSEGDAVMHILNHLESPNLSKLKLAFKNLGENFDGCYLWRIKEDIFKILKRFRNLKSFNFIIDPYQVLDFQEKEKLSVENDTVQSLEYLTIRVSPNLTFDFLYCLPSLQYLELHVVSFYPNLGNEEDTYKVEYIMDNIYKQISTGAVYRANVWGILPKLKMITFTSCLGEAVYFTREGFENNKGRAAGLSSTSSSSEDLAQILFMNQPCPFSESEDDDGEEEENEYDSDGNLIEEEEEVEEDNY